MRPLNAYATAIDCLVDNKHYCLTASFLVIRPATKQHRWVRLAKYFDEKTADGIGATRDPHTIA